MLAVFYSSSHHNGKPDDRGFRRVSSRLLLVTFPSFRLLTKGLAQSLLAPFFLFPIHALILGSFLCEAHVHDGFLPTLSPFTHPVCVFQYLGSVHHRVAFTILATNFLPSASFAPV